MAALDDFASMTDRPGPTDFGPLWSLLSPVGNLFNAPTRGYNQAVIDIGQGNPMALANILPAVAGGLLASRIPGANAAQRAASAIGGAGLGLMVPQVLRESAGLSHPERMLQPEGMLGQIAANPLTWAALPAALGARSARGAARALAAEEASAARAAAELRAARAAREDLVSGLRAEATRIEPGPEGMFKKPTFGPGEPGVGVGPDPDWMGKHPLSGSRSIPVTSPPEAAPRGAPSASPWSGGDGAELDEYMKRLAGGMDERAVGGEPGQWSPRPGVMAEAGMGARVMAPDPGAGGIIESPTLRAGERSYGGVEAAPGVAFEQAAPGSESPLEVMLRVAHEGQQQHPSAFTGNDLFREMVGSRVARTVPVVSAEPWAAEGAFKSRASGITRKGEATKAAARRARASTAEQSGPGSLDDRAEQFRALELQMALENALARHRLPDELVGAGAVEQTAAQEAPGLSLAESNRLVNEVNELKRQLGVALSTQQQLPTGGSARATRGWLPGPALAPPPLRGIENGTEMAVRRLKEAGAVPKDWMPDEEQWPEIMRAASDMMVQMSNHPLGLSKPGFMEGLRSRLSKLGTAAVKDRVSAKAAEVAAKEPLLLEQMKAKPKVDTGGAVPAMLDIDDLVNGAMELIRDADGGSVSARKATAKLDKLFTELGLSSLYPGDRKGLFLARRDFKELVEYLQANPQAATK